MLIQKSLSNIASSQAYKLSLALKNKQLPVSNFRTYQIYKMSTASSNIREDQSITNGSGNIPLQSRMATNQATSKSISLPPLINKIFDEESRSVVISLNPDYTTAYEQIRERNKHEIDSHDNIDNSKSEQKSNAALNYKRQKYESPPNPNSSTQSSSYTIPESVLQYERQMRKMKAANRAGTILTKEKHLHVMYVDEYMIAVNKPSGVLCVPGVNNKPSMVQLVYDEYGPTGDDKDIMTVDKMIVHRLDMDTSGIVVFARTIQALKTLQKSFRDRNVDKTYEALLCGQMEFLPSQSSDNDVDNDDIKYNCGTIDLALQRDHRFPPFMRVATPQSEVEALNVVNDLKNNGWKKIIKKKPKPSTTYFEFMNCYEKYHDQFPATRIKLKPITGRTHQLRVHLAAIGHPIIGDPAYGIMGEASPNGGLEEDVFSFTQRAGLELQRDINDKVDKTNQCMCLHAKHLEVPHPVTGETIVITAEPSF